MKKSILLLALGQFVLLSLFAQTWTNYTPIQNNPNINGFSVFSVGGKGYVIGGSNFTFTAYARYNKETYEYDPGSDTWSTIAQFPGDGRVYANAIEYKGKAYYGFGYRGSMKGAANDLWEFDPTTKSWSQLKDCPCAGRAEIAIVALNDTIYVGFGDDFDGTQYGDWWAYDITNDTWSQKPDFPGQTRHHPQFFALGDQIYVGLGHDDALGDLETFYKYDPATSQWTQLNDFPVQIQGPGGQFTYNGEAFVAFGLSNKANDTLNHGQFWRYKPQYDSWDQLESYSGNGYLSPLTFVIDDYAYMVTESNYWDGQGSTDFQKYYLGSVSIDRAAQLAEDLKLYPNPTTGNLTIDLSNINESARISVRNTLGQTIAEYNVSAAQKLDIELQGPKGMYVVELTTATGKTQMMKVLKN